MRKLSTYLLLFVLMFAGSACDTDSGSDSGDKEVFVGTWSLGGISDASGDRTAAFVEGFNTVQIGFRSDKVFSLVVDAVLSEADANYSGTYEIVESSKNVSVSIVVSGQAFPLVFTYNIVNDNQIKLTAAGTTSVLLSTLFNTTFAAPITITLVKG